MESMMSRERIFKVKLVAQQLIDMSIAHGAASCSTKSTIGDRQNWGIEVFAAPCGEQLFTYLAGRHGCGITADD
jgi:hypothetical protein